MTRMVLRALAVAMATLMMVAGCDGGRYHAGTDERHVIAGGGTTGVYYNYGRYLAAAMSESLDLTVVAAESRGSVDNLRSVADGHALLGFAQGDTTVDAVGGVGPFEEPMPVEAVARVYDEYVHVVVPADSDVEELGDLRGRAVSLGARGSGTEIIARRLLDAADVDVAELDARSLGIDASIEAIQRGEIEAFFWVGGLPTPGVSSLMAELPITLVPVDSLVDGVNAAHGGVYRHAVVPNGVYGTAESVPTMAVPNYLVTSSDTPPELVYDAVRVLFDARLDIARHLPVAALLDRRMAIFTEPIELHPGAVLYYRETKR